MKESFEILLERATIEIAEFVVNVLSDDTVVTLFHQLVEVGDTFCLLAQCQALPINGDTHNHLAADIALPSINGDIYHNTY